MFASSPFASIPFASQPGISDVVTTIETGVFLLSGSNISFIVTDITSPIEAGIFLLNGSDILTTVGDIISSFETGVFLLVGANITFIDESNIIVTGKSRTFAYLEDDRTFAMFNIDLTTDYQNGGC